MNELASLAEHKIKLDIVLLKNNALGMVRQWQKMFQNGVYSETDIHDVIDFEKLASAFGLRGKVVYDLQGFSEALDVAAADDVANLIVVEMNSNINVLPIIPPGKSIADSIEDWEDAETPPPAGGPDSSIVLTDATPPHDRQRRRFVWDPHQRGPDGGGRAPAASVDQRKRWELPLCGNSQRGPPGPAA